MKDLQKLFEKCIGLVEQLGIPHGEIECVTVNTRAKKRWGQAKRVGTKWGNAKWHININARLLAEDVDDSITESVILHEILHTVPGCFGHQQKWKSLAALLNQRYGYRIHTTDTYDTLGIEPLPEELAARAGVPHSSFPYQVRCMKCGTVLGRRRMSKLIRFPAGYRHAGCGGKFERIK